MSWQMAIFAMLGAVLIGGFAWYERSRPPSQIVALVAALAALAVAGRLVLAPIPNVVATTDVALFSGYALGGAPGFAVGALAGLISNFWLGQGPWTPWQMAGWGLAGILGAAARTGDPAPGGKARADGGVRLRRDRIRSAAELLADGELRGRADLRPLAAAGGARGPVRPCSRDRQHHPCPGRRPGDREDARSLPRALRIQLGGRCAPWGQPAQAGRGHDRDRRRGGGGRRACGRARGREAELGGVAEAGRQW